MCLLGSAVSPSLGLGHVKCPWKESWFGVKLPSLLQQGVWPSDVAWKCPPFQTCMPRAWQQSPFTILSCSMRPKAICDCRFRIADRALSVSSDSHSILHSPLCGQAAQNAELRQRLVVRHVRLGLRRKSLDTSEATSNAVACIRATRNSCCEAREPHPCLWVLYACI